MAAKKQNGGQPINPQKYRGITTMLIRNEIPAEEFLKAYGKYNYAKTQK